MPGEDTLRIAYLTSRYPAISHTFIFREVLRLRERGIDVRVASINEPDRPAEDMPIDEASESEKTFYVKRQGAWRALITTAVAVAVSPLDVLRGLTLAIQLAGADIRRIVLHLFYFVEALLLIDWMKRNRLTHLHVHFATAVATVALLAARISRTPFSMTVHGPDEFFDVSRYSLKTKVEEAAFICCIGEFCKSQLMKEVDPRYWPKLVTVPLGVDLEEFAPQDHPGTLPEFRMLCVGRLVPQKGQHILLDAMARLASMGRQAHLTLVGDGPHRASLERLVHEQGLANRVTFTGPQNRNRVRGYLAESDLFVLPSFAEGIPVALMEAMAMEVPCISTYVAGIPELIRSGCDGELVPASDADALAAAIARLMEDDSLRREMGRSSRRRIGEKYNLEKNIGLLAETFREWIPAGGAQ